MWKFVWYNWLGDDFGCDWCVKSKVAVVVVFSVIYMILYQSPNQSLTTQ